jgi:DNA-directed RNA polymerase subunit H
MFLIDNWTIDYASLTLLLGVFLVKREHELVPAHRIMSKTDVSELLTKMGVGLNNLPKIQLSDPQVKKLEAKVGDVIAISRNDYGREYMHYRIVVAKD